MEKGEGERGGKGGEVCMLNEILQFGDVLHYCEC